MRKKSGGQADQKLQEVLNRLKRAKGPLNLALDTETSGLDWRRNHIVGYVLTFSPRPDDSYYIPFRHLGSANVGGQSGPTTLDGWDGKLSRGEKELLDALLRPEVQAVGHNLSFDLKFLYRVAGTRAFIPQYEDTIINEPLINEFAPKFGLEHCCLRHGVQPKLSKEIVAYLRAKFPEIKSDREAMGHYWRLSGDDPMAVEYAEGDGTSTWQLRDAQMVEIAKPVEIGVYDGVPLMSDMKTVHNIESRLIRVLARMTCKGIRVDVEALEDLIHNKKTGLNARIDKMMQILPPGASIWGKADLVPYFEKLGHTDWPVTAKKRKPSITEAWLKTFPAGQEVLKVRQLTHLRDSFILPLLNDHLWNGRCHANFNQLRNDDFGTITGRLSCDSPNLQQAHKRDAERGRILRGLFLPDPGMIFGEVDYSQCEPRLLAYYSRAKVLLDGYRAVPSVDAHTAVTRAMNLSKGYDDWDKAKQKAARENGKRVNQTLVTGGGKGVIVAKYGVDPAEVGQIWNDYFRAMPEIKQLQRIAGNKMRMRGFVTSLLGRRARLRDPDKSYIAVNRLLQCGNADILKSKMVEIDDYLESEGRPPVDLLNNIHDAFDFQFDPAHRKVYDECLAIMTKFGPDDLIPLDVPMEIDAGEGSTWAEATFGAEE